jgi:hypothetical protein
MSDSDDSIDIDIAATLRDIAANCDKTTGKVLKLCNEAAAEGKSHITVKVSVEDREYLLDRWYANHGSTGYGKERAARYHRSKAPPLIQKLESLGFTLEYSNESDIWGTQRYIEVSW